MQVLIFFLLLYTEEARGIKGLKVLINSKGMWESLE